MESPKQLEPDSSEYWKKQAKHYEQKANDIQHELDEYTENSAQLEKELEASLDQVEKQNKDLMNQNERLKDEIASLRSKLERSHHETEALEKEIQTLKKEKDKQGIYIRELEQKNDDLERGQRIISESVSCIETLLNQAYERNAVLESEVDELENLRVNLQRATDEARDLKQELKVIEKIPTVKKEETSTNENVCNGHLTARAEIETQTSVTSPLKREVNGNTLTPSARVSAINIVGDLLRKVGLERFLCHECGKVKCSCGVSTVAEYPPALEVGNHGNGNATPADLDPVEFRPPAPFTRQYSRSEQSKSYSQRSPHSQIPPDKTPESGKLRRSFIVRSREGLENFLNFSSVKKSEGKDKLRQQF